MGQTCRRLGSGSAAHDSTAGGDMVRGHVGATVDKVLREVVSDNGTGTAAKSSGYRWAGKAGTAQQVDPTTGEYSNVRYDASFVGYAPAENPQLLVAVVVDEPTIGSYYGGDVAAPAFEDIAEFSLRSLRIAP